MENASRALEMAGAVLIFLFAFSVIMFSFTKVRKTSDVVMNYRDREAEYEHNDSYYYYNVGNGTRVVGLETLIPSIYRAYLENYRIVFIWPNNDSYVIYIYEYKIRNVRSESYKKNVLDLNQYENEKDTNGLSIVNNVSLANDEQKKRFIKGILYRDFSSNKSDENGETAFKNYFSVELPSESLYEHIKNSNYKIIEHLGVYYQSDDENVPNVNKVKKRIITYTFE